MNRWLGLLLAVASAILLFVAGEPLGWGPVAWVALIPLFVAIAGAKKVRWAWLSGLVFGLSYFGIHIAWIFLFGWMAWSALVVAMSLHLSLGALVAGLVRRAPVAPVLMAGAFTGAELLRDRWPYGGYSWGSIGTTQGPVPFVRWLAGVVGVYGLTFLIAFVAALVAYAVVERRFSWASVIAVGVALMGFVWADLAVYGGSAHARSVRMVVVQGGVPRPARPGQRDAIFDSHVRITRRLLAPYKDSDPLSLDRNGPPDVVVWPEDALGVGVRPSALDEVRMLAQEYGVPFVIGHSEIRRRTRFVNLTKHIDAAGTVRGEYQKRHPVPFGEYVPIPFLRRFVGTLQSEIPADLESGTDVTVFDVDGRKIATPICFESVFPRDFLDFSRKGAELFVVSTNNASFERSYASQQHIAHARMRALEMRQYVVQNALAGISAVVAPDGTLSHATELFESDGFVADVEARRPSTLYSKVGDLFAELFAVASAVGALLVVIRGRRRRADTAILAP